MNSTITTFLQLFGIGFSLGMTGPCLFTCVPVVTAYVSGTGKKPREIFTEILLFLSGRLAAAIFFGFLAGVSARFLNVFLNSKTVSYLRPLGGALIILLGFSVLFGKRSFPCAGFAKKAASGGVFLLGFFIGLAPCPPFIALFAEIALMSKSVLDGIFYAFFFGSGLFVSGLIALSAASGVLTGFLPKMLNEKSKRIFRIVCGLLMVVMGTKWFL